MEPQKPSTSQEWEKRPPASSISSIGQAAMIHMQPPMGGSAQFYPYPYTPDDVKVESGMMKSGKINAAIICAFVSIALVTAFVVVILEVCGVFGQRQPTHSSS